MTTAPLSHVSLSGLQKGTPPKSAIKSTMIEEYFSHMNTELRIIYLILYIHIFVTIIQYNIILYNLWLFFCYIFLVKETPNQVR